MVFEERRFMDLFLAAYDKLSIGDFIRNRYQNFRVLFLVPFDDLRRWLEGFAIEARPAIQRAWGPFPA